MMYLPKRVRYVAIDLTQKSQNAPAPHPTMFHSEPKCAHFCSEALWGMGHCGIWNGCILGFVKLVYDHGNL